MTKRIAQVIVGLPVEGPFDYSIGNELSGRIAVGQRVCVPFNRRNRLGMVVGFKKTSPFKELKPVLSILDKDPSLGDQTLALTRAIADHYGCSWGEAVETYLPEALRHTRAVNEYTFASKPMTSQKTASPACTLVIDETQKERWVYLQQRIKGVLEKGGGVIFLVPEAALTAFVINQFKHIQPAGVVLDGKTSSKDALLRWHDIRDGKIRFVVGPRSAIFAPVKNLALIVVYDEENRSYKQEQTPHYHAREVALMRAKIEGCEVLFVSSAPTAELWHLISRKGMTKVALKAKEMCPVQVVDMSNYNPRRSFILSIPLQHEMEKTLQNGGKTLLFMNRRGFFTRTHCNQCGFTLRCERCDANMTYLYSKKKMVCRHCQAENNLPKVCPQCQGSYLRSTGRGGEKLESEVARVYPQAVVGRYDKDTGALPAKFDILIATQAVLRFKEDLSVDLVGFVQFDAELSHLDFRSAQRLFTLITQLRQCARGKMVIQTRMPDNYVLLSVKKNSYTAFYRQELNLRKEVSLPPYAYLVSVCLRGRKEDVVFQQAHDIFERLTKNKPASVAVGDPRPDVLPKLRDQYRYLIEVKGKSLEKIMHYVKNVLKDFRRKHNTIITLDVDP